MAISQELEPKHHFKSMLHYNEILAVPRPVWSKPSQPSWATGCQAFPLNFVSPISNSLKGVLVELLAVLSAQSVLLIKEHILSLFLSLNLTQIATTYPQLLIFFEKFFLCNAHRSASGE